MFTEYGENHALLLSHKHWKMAVTPLSPHIAITVCIVTVDRGTSHKHVLWRHFDRLSSQDFYKLDIWASAFSAVVELIIPVVNYRVIFTAINWHSVHNMFPSHARASYQMLDLRPVRACGIVLPSSLRLNDHRSHHIWFHSIWCQICPETLSIVNEKLMMEYVYIYIVS